MKELPEPETYVEGLDFWPYRASLAAVVEHIVSLAPVSATLLDVMCGPGHLLGMIREKRADLILSGVDIDPRYTSFGQLRHSFARFETGDVLNWRPAVRQSIVVCTGSIHHVPYEQQEHAIAQIASMVMPGGIAIISDCYVDDYSTEQERKLAAEKLGHEYLVATIRNGAPENVVGWTADILYNDLLMYEFKPSLSMRLPQIQKHFPRVETTKIWPDIESGYGDYMHICHT